MIDLIVRVVPDYGYLPIVEVDGEEIYRGEFKDNAGDALTMCMIAAEKWGQ